MISKQLTLVERCEATVGGKHLSYFLRRSTRARHARLEIKPQTGLTVIIPRRYNIEQVPRLLEAKKRWIWNNLARSIRLQAPDEERKLGCGDIVPYLGRDLLLVRWEDDWRPGVIKLEQDRLLVSPSLFRDGVLEVALEQWYRYQAARVIKDKADELGAKLRVVYTRLIIRGQKTRWGSCSRRKTLSFNWRLLMAPQPVMDYVIIHELAHLKELNHSRKFWKLVAEHCPQWSEHRKWLKEHEAELHARLRPRS